MRRTLKTKFGGPTVSGVIAALLLGSALTAQAGLVMGPPAAADNKDIPPNTSGPRDFAGIWWPRTAGSSGFSTGGGGPGSGPGGPPSGGGAGGPPSGMGGGAPQGGQPPGGGGGDTAGHLQCAPQFKLAGGGGGSTVLIVQSDKELVMAGEELVGTFQRMYIGGTHPKASELVPQPNGHVIAHWEGDTLVADGIGYADANGKDIGQHVVERISKKGDRLMVEVTVTDKSGTSKTMSGGWGWRPDLQYNESICEEDFDRYELVNGVTESGNSRK